MNDNKTPNAQNDRRTIPSSAQRPITQTGAQNAANAQRPVAQTTAQNAANAQRPVGQATAQNAPGAQRPVAQTTAQNAANAQRPVGQTTAQNAPSAQRPVAQTTAQNAANSQRPIAQTTAQNAPSAQRPVGQNSRTIPRRQTSFTPSETRAPRPSRDITGSFPDGDESVKIFSGSADVGSAQSAGDAAKNDPTVKSAPTIKSSASLTNAAAKAKRRQKGEHTAGEVIREEGASAVLSLVKAAIYLVAVLVVSAVISVSVILIGNDMFAFVKESRDVQIVVPVGTDLDGLKDILAEAGLVKYPRIFKLYADHKTKDNQNFATLEFVPEDYVLPEGKSAVFIAGTYDLNTDMDYEDLLWSFLPPEKSGTSWVTIPEGFTTDEIINLLVEKGIGERDEYVEVINTYDFSSFWFVKELEESGKWSVDEYKRTGKVSSGRIYRLDGYLFPDTYEFYNASREETVIKKMLYRFSQIYGSEYRDMADAQGFTTDELITLSSMIEKEAGRPNDFFSVSEVFRNRLDSPEYFPYLQSDATVLYQISHEKGERPKHVTHEDTLLEVAYNTYTNTGLPPGPISNPSATAILAALNPSKNGYYYFVSGPEVTHFSTNQWDHNYWVGVTSAEWAAAGEN